MSNMLVAQKTQSFDEFRASVASLVENYRQADTSKTIDNHKSLSEPVNLLQAKRPSTSTRNKFNRKSQHIESKKPLGTKEEIFDISRPPSRGSLKSSYSFNKVHKGDEHLISPETSSCQHSVRSNLILRSNIDNKYVKRYVEELEDLLRYEKLKRIRSETMLKKVLSRKQ